LRYSICALRTYKETGNIRKRERGRENRMAFGGAGLRVFGRKIFIS